MTGDRSGVSQDPLDKIDVTVPHSARIWNYWLGGKDNYEIDRMVGEQVAQLFPGIRETARVSRALLTRIIKYLAGEAGIRQFLDVGTGLPTVDNTHQVAQRIAPESRIVYVDNDPLVLVHARALLTSSPEGASDYVDADLHDSDRIASDAARTLDFAKPIALILHGIMGHVEDDGEARACVRRLVDALPSGSYLAMSDGTNTDEASVRSMELYKDSGAVPYHLRSPAVFAGFFDGLNLVEPGIVAREDWHPDSALPADARRPPPRPRRRRPQAVAHRSGLGLTKRLDGSSQPLGFWLMSDFMGMVARARVRTDEKDWAAAAELWSKVTTANPVNGDYWARLGEARFGAQDYAGAREAYEQVLRLGLREMFLSKDAPPLMAGEVAYRIACCEAAAGKREAAVAALRAALDRGMRDPARVKSDEHWQELRTDQRVRDMTGIIDTGSMSRDEGWRYDLAFLAKEIKRLAYAPFALQPEAEFDRTVAELDTAIPGLTDAQILVGMMKLVRHLDDGHASVTWPKDHSELSRMLPVDLFWFTEGLHVIGAAPGCEHLLGARVDKIGGLTIDEVMAALDPVMTRDNEHWLTLKLPVLVRYTAVLDGLGIGHALTVRLFDGTIDEVRLEAAPIEFHWDGRYPPGWVALADTVTADGIEAVPRPLHLRNRELPFWFECLPADDLVYFQFNAVRDHPAETFAAFCDRLFGFTEDRNVGRLVIDMRWNGGGNTGLARHLLHHLIASKRLSRRGALFVIIGRLTFSAAQNTATAIEHETSAIFVGEPTGSRPNFIGERIDFELPYSKLQANAGDLYWQTSWPADYRTWIAPDIYAPPTFEAYCRNQDPALDAILAIREHVPG